jgi:hypothetical protein
MNIHDYLIDPAGKDWPRLLAYWTPPMPGDASLWLVNKLGEIFYASKGGTVHRLVVGTGAVEELAPDRQSFARLLDDPRNAEAWLRIGLVRACHEAGMRLSSEECFGFEVPPALQGAYVVSNLRPTNIYSHYSWLAHLARQDEIYWTGN